MLWNAIFCLLLSLLTAMLSSFRCRRVIVKPCYARSVSQTTFMLDTDLTSARSTEIAGTARWQHVSGICWLAQFAHFMHVVWLFCFDSLRFAENGSVFVWVWVFFYLRKSRLWRYVTRYANNSFACGVNFNFGFNSEFKFYGRWFGLNLHTFWRSS